jgi:alpha-tubulin suppressor-like RCC1 family protein
MRFSTRRRRPLRLCALAALSVGLLFPAGAAQATATGTVVAWGCAGFDVGQCSVPGGLSDVTAIAAGTYHSVALKGDGTVVAWGCIVSGNYGQCSVPGGLSDVTAIAAGEAHSLALKGDGTVVAWGCAGFNLGQCSVPGGLSAVTAIAAGSVHSLALKGDGTVVAWGCAGTDLGQCSVPAGLSDVTAIAAGSAHSLALKGDGTVVAWGCAGVGDYGQCSVPGGLSGVTAIAAGAFHSLALKGDGTVVAWGCGSSDYGQCSVPGGLSGVTAIDSDYYSLALKGDGTVVAWGCAGFDVGQCSVPSSLSGVIAIAAGFGHSLALVRPTNRPPDCSAVFAAPDSISPQTRDKLTLITLSGATDPDGDTLVYHIDGVTQDEYVTGVGDDTFPDAALTSAGADSNQVFVRPEVNSHFNGRVYRIAYTVSDGNGGSCSGTAGPSGNTTATVGVPRKKGTTAIDDGNAMSWDSFTGAFVS